MLGACAQNNMLFIDIVGLATQPSTKNLMKDEGTPKERILQPLQIRWS